MRLRFLAALTALSLTSGVAFASPNAVGASTGAKVVGGTVAVAGGGGAIAGITKMFRTSDKHVALAVTRAPEISTTGTTAGLILLVGGILVLRGRQRSAYTAK